MHLSFPHPLTAEAMLSSVGETALKAAAVQHEAIASELREVAVRALADQHAAACQAPNLQATLGSHVHLTFYSSSTRILLVR